MSKHGVSAFGLKIAAIMGMTCNHVANVFATCLPEWLTVSLYVFGGLTFPIMAFLLCEGYRHTSNIRRYALRLGVFALVAQVPYSLLWGATANVLATLLIGLGLLWTSDHVRNPLARWAIILVGTLISSPCDWGIIGPVMILLFHHLRGNPRGVLIVMLVPLLSIGLPAVQGVIEAWNSPAQEALQAKNAPEGQTERTKQAERAPHDPQTQQTPQAAPSQEQPAQSPAPRNTIEDAGYLSTSLGSLGYCTVGFGLATLLITRYNGQRGRPLKWFFYLYYPAHLVILWALTQIW